MLKNPKITVIMPTFNRAGLISKSIESVLNQTFKDFEFYILDDGSNDNTKEVVEQYLKDNRVKYLYHKNQGEAETVNLGWSLAKGEYFTQVNSDDTIALNSFEIMVKELDKHKKCVLAYPDFNFIDENDNIILVDYKTDYVKKSEQELVDKYKKQLQIYKSALEEALQKEVYKTYIYSIYLGKSIEVED